MSARGSKSPIILDWFNVSYRSVILGVCCLVLLVGAAGGYWYYSSMVAPKTQASEAIHRATQKLAEIGGLEGDDRVQQARANARTALEEARSAFDSADYDVALQAALRSENLSIKALELVRGSGTGTTLVRFLRIEGDVKVKQAGEFSWEVANPKMLLRVGDQVKTSSTASAQLLYFDGSKTTIQPGSLLEIRNLFEDPVTKVRRVQEKLTWGVIEASTQKKNVEGSYHEVSTDVATARSEEEGEYRVAYDQDHKTAKFDVFQGKIEVASSDRRESLQSGERIQSASDGTLSAKELLPAVPRLISPSDQRVYVYDDPTSAELTVSWEPVKGAAQYRLSISDKTLFTSPLYDSRRVDTTAVINGVQPGAYYWKVAAISLSGVQGPFSEVRRFRVSSQKIRDKGDKTPPVLEITDSVLTGPMLIINGKTEPGALLWIDNEKTDVYDDGTFYAVIRLRKEGWNKIQFVSQDASGNETRLQHRAYVETY
jgi:hypothetical protein